MGDAGTEKKLLRHEILARIRGRSYDSIKRLEHIAYGEADALGEESVPLKLQKEALELLLAYGLGRPSVMIDVTQREKVRTLPAPPPKPGDGMLMAEIAREGFPKVTIGD